MLFLADFCTRACLRWLGWGCCPAYLPTPCSLPAADREFIEARRRALRRFINLVARHPPFSEDVALRLFLSFSGPVSTSLSQVGPEVPYTAWHFFFFF